MTATLRIDPIRCRGHAICALVHAEGIELDHWGFGRVVVATPHGRRALRRAMRAAAACPNQAIVVTVTEPPAGPEQVLPPRASVTTPEASSRAQG